ncbi:MAG: fimbrillin family protein [Rikenellaceae bacterium]
MKRFIYILSLILATTSCQEEISTLAETSGDTINFVADIFEIEDVIATRGELITTQTIESFGVFAYGSYDSESADEASFMVNQSVTRNDDTWSYSPTKRWGSTVLFYAYSPYSPDSDTAITPSTSGGELVIDYKVPTDVLTQYDLMLSTPIVQSAGDVKLTFTHQLSAVSFAITGDGTRKVTAMSVKGLNNYGCLTQSSDGAVAWSGVGCDQTQIYSVEVVADITPSTTPKTLTADGYTLLMIPQVIPTVAAVEVTTVSLTNASDVQVLSLSFDSTQGEWEANNQYLYTMNITTSTDVTDVDLELAVEIVEWVETPEITLW